MTTQLSENEKIVLVLVAAALLLAAIFGPLWVLKQLLS
jgi:hypothetical protein